MPTHKEQLSTGLRDRGWEIVQVAEEGEDWWADEHWTAESRKNHWGKSVIVHFLVDPMWDGPRKKGQGVWAISATSSMPGDRIDAERGVAFLRLQKGHFGEQLLAFLDGLETWRNSLDTST